MTLIRKLPDAGRKRGAMAVLLWLALLLACADMAVADTIDGHSRAVAAGEVVRIAVVYPDIGEPYRSVFEQIISGIEDKTGAGLPAFVVGPDTDLGKLKSDLRSRGIKVVIALGSQGVRFAGTLDRDIGVVVGGILSPPDRELRDVPVKSLSPAPVLLFSHLKVLMPGLKRVFAVYEPRQNGWLIRQARESARAQDLELVAYEVQDLRAAAATYQAIFASADSRRDAIWLLQDPFGSESGAILPMVLQESWNRSLVVFSGNLAHVRRGALFSLYPDNTEMGRNLAVLALSYLASGEYGEHGMIMLSEVQMAINLRTADHLGLKPGKKLEFGMVFPEP
jgi:putative ABC transport system substrate-binding protein